MIHLGISGPIGAGKSTLAQQLSEFFPSAIIPFAYGVKQIAALELHDNRLQAITDMFVIYGAPHTMAYIAASMIDGQMTKYPSMPGIKNRRLLQFIGTEAGRKTIHPDIWIEVVKQQMIPLQNRAAVIFSDDLRFNNESDAVDLHIGIKTNACYDTRTQNFTPQYMFSDHESEHSLTRIPDVVIPACWSNQDLQNLIDLITVALD